MCVGPLAPPKPQTPKVVVQGKDPQSEKQIQQERRRLEQQRQEFQQAQQQFNKDQQKWLQEQKNQQAAQAPVVAPQRNTQQAPQTASEDEKALASRRRGRSKLRIPLNNSTAGSGGTGLNIPKG